ncbi:hypothetical protein H6F67_00475 [Microcoleus sp. FACHB-1515]|uniref:hypothetical protein n=1 Tax=Cyanophyceae TaxID=3028117 RepID=UPI0016847E7C|nr:hypothetical protein [Microcoleus sp. FACHB-1515]MBD2088351.1 hypothetical protein [Microcoleus sp. FACHB-1515]
MQQPFNALLKTFLLGSTVVGIAIALQLPTVAQRSPNSSRVPLDNIYHERDNLPDDADVFPRMGRIAGSQQEQSNCRVAPWGRVVTRFPGRSSVEIDRRQVDRNGESWFHNPDGNCWVHDSRIDLL